MLARYPTDLTDSQWGVLGAAHSGSKSGGRPRSTDMREVVNAVFYILRGGCQWRLLPKDFPPYQTVYDYFRSWRLLGNWERLHDRLRGDVREAHGRNREPSAGIIDSQTVETTEKGGSAVGDASQRTVALRTSERDALAARVAALQDELKRLFDSAGLPHNQTERQRAVSSQQRGSRNPRPPDPLLFGDDILRRLLRRVSPAKSTSAPLRF